MEVVLEKEWRGKERIGLGLRRVQYDAMGYIFRRERLST